MLRIFHLHKFDPENWTMDKEVNIYGYEDPCGNRLPVEKIRLYRNTCLTCGDLVFRKQKI